MIKPFYNPERVECVRWSPGTARLLLLLLLGFAALPVKAQELAPQPNLSVRPVLEVHYSAGAGGVFELQGSDDLRSWRDLGDAVFGEGEQVQSFFPADGDAPSAYRYYRVKILSPQSFGFAPMHLIRKQLEFNDEGSALRLDFETRSSGSAAGEGFTYSYQKLGDTLGRLTIRRDGGSDRIDLDFAADLVGNYTRSEIRGGVVKDIDTGTFALGTVTHPSPDPSANLIPESLMGCTFVFSDDAGHERLDFVTGLSGRGVDRAEVENFAYQYSESRETSTATIFYPGEIAVEFEMTFTGAGSSGTYVRREFVDGELDLTDEGIFSCARSIYHAAGADSTNVTLPVDELTGRSYLIRDGGTPQRLQFQTAFSGRLVEGNQVDPFEFDYLVKCNASATITIRFGDGDYDEYHLNHTDETFVRHEVRGGERIDSDTGTFSESQ